MKTVIAAIGLCVVSASTTSADPVGRIVVGHDANTLGTNLADASSERFAVNVASYLTQGGGDRLLLIETEPPFASHDYAAGVETALTDAGFDLTVVDARLPLPSLAEFDAVFVGIAARDDYETAQASEFKAFIRAGGGAYVYSGVGSGCEQEGAALNALIGEFGLSFDTSCQGGDPNGYNVQNSVVVDPAAHPIFEGITLLLSNHGQWINADPGYPDVQIVASFGGHDYYGVAEVVVCNPADLAPPFGVLDLADVSAFTAGFIAMDPIADLNADGLFDLNDVNLFVASFLTGCP